MSEKLSLIRVWDESHSSLKQLAVSEGCSMGEALRRLYVNYSDNQIPRIERSSNSGKVVNVEADFRKLLKLNSTLADMTISQYVSGLLHLHFNSLSL